MSDGKVCECGCGLALGKYAKSFRHGHWARANKALISKWKRKGIIPHTKGGYMLAFDGDKRRLQHIVIAESALGRKLPMNAEVHHVNKMKWDNRNENLVICPDRAYHQLLHTRTLAYESCGDANKRRCAFCREWDFPGNLYIPLGPGAIEHRSCGREYRRKRLLVRMNEEQSAKS